MGKPVQAARLVYLPGGPLATADDATLAEAMIAGNDHAPRIAWSRFSPMVFRMMKRTFGPGQDVDDMVQDVFLCLFRKVGSLREPKSLKAFVISITALTIKYELRQRRVRRWIHLSGSVAELEGPRTEQPDAGARQALVSFYAILDRLSARDRAAFVLRFFEGLELTQVADALGISVSTTKRHLTRIWNRVTLLVQRSPQLVGYVPLSLTGAGGAGGSGNGSGNGSKDDNSEAMLEVSRALDLAAGEGEGEDEGEVAVAVEEENRK